MCLIQAEPCLLYRSTPSALHVRKRDGKRLGNVQPRLQLLDQSPIGQVGFLSEIGF